MLKTVRHCVTLKCPSRSLYIPRDEKPLLFIVHGIVRGERELDKAESSEMETELGVERSSRKDSGFRHVVFLSSELGREIDLYVEHIGAN